jgi:RNA polymerase sigma-70 factor (ECF subfamily)
MQLDQPCPEAAPSKAPWFTTTHWSVVLMAGQSATPQAQAALEKLCRTYWYPLYAFVRRQGHSPHDAQDLTQEFFARLLEKDYLNGLDPSKGKFRTFLLVAMKHFLANEWRRGQAQKRGAGAKHLSLDETSAEGQYLQIAAPELPPERVFEQQWGFTLLAQVIARLREEFISDGKGPVFEELKIFLTGEKHTGVYAPLAARLKTTEAALKMTVSRMRQRYGELAREEIANTVPRPEDVEEELRALLAAVSG